MAFLIVVGTAGCVLLMLMCLAAYILERNENKKEAERFSARRTAAYKKGA